jgi:hypothetical protein
MAKQTMRRAARLAASQVRAQPRVSGQNVTALEKLPFDVLTPAG